MKINVTEYKTPSIFLLNAICKQFPRDDMLEALNIPPGEQHVDVKLTVNGVEIPFEATINDLWKQCQDDLNTRALEQAKKIVLGAGLEELFDKIRQSEWEIENAFKAALTKLGDNDVAA
jgi:hypothetical protein